MRGNKGFTIIEVMVATVIFLLMLSTALYVYTGLYVSYARDGDRIEVQENLRFALKKISYGIRQAGNVTVLNDSQIVLTPVSGSIKGYRYDRAGGEAEVNVGGVYLPLASHIQCINFVYDPESRVATVTIRGQKGNSGIIEMSTKAHVRKG